jgi:hypothetical protein
MVSIAGVDCYSLGLLGRSRLIPVAWSYVLAWVTWDLEPTRRDGMPMSEAFFALAGALIGVLGGVLTAAFGARAEDRRANREALRAVCTDFATATARVRRLSIELRRDSDNPSLELRVEEALTDARASYERLRLTTESYSAQEAARHVVHFSNWMSWSARKKRDDFEEAHTEFHRWTKQLYEEMRRELGVKRPTSVYTDPLEGLPGPTAGSDSESTDARPTT